MGKDKLCRFQVVGMFLSWISSLGKCDLSVSDQTHRKLLTTLRNGSVQHTSRWCITYVSSVSLFHFRLDCLWPLWDSWGSFPQRETVFGRLHPRLMFEVSPETGNTSLLFSHDGLKILSLSVDFNWWLPTSVKAFEVFLLVDPISIVSPDLPAASEWHPSHLS